MKSENREELLEEFRTCPWCLTKANLIHQRKRIKIKNVTVVSQYEIDCKNCKHIVQHNLLHPEYYIIEDPDSVSYRDYDVTFLQHVVKVK